jgi:solute carrier family 25 phosphate transporter 3
MNLSCCVVLIVLQVSFDLFASLLYSTLIGLSFVPQKKIALEVEIGAAFCASVMACLASHPGDVLLTATYKNGGNQNNVAAIVNEGGGFFRGLNARFIHVGCIITLQLVLYDQIKQALGLPASGS